MARPSSFRKEMLNRVLELGSEGKSKLEIARELGVSRMTLNRWERENPKFRDAMEEATEASQAFWEAYIRRAAMGQEEDVNTKLLEIYMRNRFDDWNTARKEEKTVNETITIDHVGNIRDRMKLLTGRIQEDVVDVEELPGTGSGEAGGKRRIEAKDGGFGDGTSEE